MKFPSKLPFLFHWFPEVTSTNTLGLEAARRNEAPWQVWITDHQTQGRGRRVRSERRTWVERPGTSILMSVLLRPRLSPELVSSLTLLAGVSFAEVLRETSGVQVGLKWPNDLVVGSRKLGGILAEGVVHKDTVAVVMGVGVNINARQEELAQEVRHRATSLAIEAGGKTFPRETLAVAMMERLRRDLLEAETCGHFRGVLERWRALSAMGGRRVVCSEDGAPGVAKDVNERGELVVVLDGGGERVVRSGEVTFLP